MRIGIWVVPNSKKFLIKKYGNGFKICLKSKAEKGKANVELVKEFKRALKRGVRIISGLKSRKKVVEIEGQEEEILEAIKSCCSG